MFYTEGNEMCCIVYSVGRKLGDNFCAIKLENYGTGFELTLSQTSPAFYLSAVQVL